MDIGVVAQNGSNRAGKASSWHWLFVVTIVLYACAIAALLRGGVFRGSVPWSGPTTVIKLFVVVCPIYILIAWSMRARWIIIDYVVQLVPPIAWYIALC